jgi:hypothetical protein
MEMNALFAWLISHQRAVLFSQNKPATSTFISEQISTSHHPPAKQTGWKGWILVHVDAANMICM